MNIGYVLKYDGQLDRGVIVYGSYIKYFNRPPDPIVFSRVDCSTEVSTGNLVYFEPVHKTQSEDASYHIEVASLVNFKREFIHDFKDSHKSTIDFLVDGHSLRRLMTPETTLEDEDEFEEKDDDEEEGFDSWDFELFDRPEIHNLMGDRSVRIFDLSLWLDESILHERSCFGKTASEFLELIDLFTCDSDDLRVFLPFFSDNDLRLILEKHPALQRILPERFALDNINLLSEEYDFPSNAVCKLFYYYTVKNIRTTEEYCRLKDLFKDSIDHSSNRADKISVCNLYINDLYGLLFELEKVYYHNVFSRQKCLFAKMCPPETVVEERFNTLLRTGERDYLIDLGYYIDYSSNESHIDYSFGLIESFYNKLRDTDKQLLSQNIKQEAIKYLNDIAHDPDSNGKAGWLHSFINEYEQYLDQHAIKQVIELVNPELANSNDIEDLIVAFEHGFISEEQYSKRIMDLTNDYSSESLKELIDKNHFKNPPLIQEFFIKEIIQRSPYSFSWDGEILLTWFVEQTRYGDRFDLPILRNTLETVLTDISENDWWKFFKNKSIRLLPNTLIRKKLNEAYSQDSLSADCFHEECFQEAMVEDVLSEKCASEKLFLILANLESKGLNQVLSRGNETLSFFAWAYLPSEEIIHEDINWTSLSHYFSLLPPEQQLRVFKFLLYLKAKKYESYTLQELVSQLSNGSNEVCHALQALIHILLDLSESLDSIITSRDIKSFFFYESERDLGAFALFASLFKFCNGRHLLSKYEKRGGGAFGRIEKKVKNNAPFFVITF